jgi:APA family basic amino acid/polyamine antiporter
MAGLPWTAWYRFGIWMALGAAVYFAYGYRNSVLGRRTAAPPG